MRYRADIDGLRALAVLSVLGFHLFPHYVRGGFVGVDIFFVISGFLISCVLMDDIDQGHTCGELLRRFYFRRVRRIFPALLLVLAVAWAVGWWLLLPEEYSRLGIHISGGAGFVANLLYWNEAGYFDSSATSKPLLHLWSLGVEEQFYLIWPVLLVVLWTARIRGWAFAVLIGGSLTLALVTVRYDAAAAFYSPGERFWELLVGAALAYASRHDIASHWWERRRILRDMCSLLGVALIAVALIRIDRAAVFPGWKVLVPVVGAALVIAAGSTAWINARVFSFRGFVWIGLISYPLYLWHWPIFSFTRIVGGDPAAPARVLIGVASIVLAAATYWLVERPLRSRPATAPMIGVLCVVALVVGCAGIATRMAHGYPGRLPAPVQQLVRAAHDQMAELRGHRCLLFPDENETVFAQECLDDDPSKTSLPEVVLWGDSHAAQLYVGFAHRYGRTLRISQLTVGGCPPLFGVPGRWANCAALMDTAFRRLASRAPNVVVVGAEWINYDWRALPATLERLRSAGVSRVIVVGEVPVWDGRFPELLARTVLRDRPAFRIPERTSAGLLVVTFDVDRGMAPLARQFGATYVSAANILSDDNGCLTRAGGNVTTFDESHLTPSASRYLVEHFQNLW
jgi:peptidoglycan/LPS O-acetylase OafA/YrhL